MYFSNSVISSIISKTCQNFYDNSSSDCHNLERNNSLVMTILKHFGIGGWCEFVFPLSPEKKRKLFFYEKYFILSWVELSSANILWLELWNPPISTMRWDVFLINRGVSKEEVLSFRQLQLPHCASIWLPYWRANIFGVHTARYVMQNVIRQDWDFFNCQEMREVF